MNDDDRDYYGYYYYYYCYHHHHFCLSNVRRDIFLHWETLTGNIELADRRRQRWHHNECAQQYQAASETGNNEVIFQKIHFIMIRVYHSETSLC